jgi:quercetin dioxygenase-like cupin family protein
MGDHRPAAMRLLVTGHDDEGRATLAGDGPVEATVLSSGTALHRLWGCDTAPAFRFSVWTVPPGYTSPVHATPTVDCGIVLSGELWLELEDGVEQHLRSGDAFVQNGTRHAWRNRGDQPAVVALFIAAVGDADLPF